MLEKLYIACIAVEKFEKEGFEVVEVKLTPNKLIVVYEVNNKRLKLTYDNLDDLLALDGKET